MFRVSHGLAARWRYCHARRQSVATSLPCMQVLLSPRAGVWPRPGLPAADIENVRHTDRLTFNVVSEVEPAIVLYVLYLFV